MTPIIDAPQGLQSWGSAVRNASAHAAASSITGGPGLPA